MAALDPTSPSFWSYLLPSSGGSRATWSPTSHRRWLATWWTVRRSSLDPPGAFPGAFLGDLVSDLPSGTGQHRQYRRRPAGHYGRNHLGDSGELADYLAEHGLQMPVLMDEDGTIARAWG